MRNEFVNFLMEKEKNKKADDCVLITGDLGFSVLEPVREAWGKRFINAGISESLMTTIAASISYDGFKVFTYSITPFATFRCLEQIRNDICYHDLDVTVVGVGSGFGYGPLGPTHHSTEDLAALWSLPNMKVYCPADLNEAKSCYEDSWNKKGPNYLRIGKGREGFLSDLLIDVSVDPVIQYTAGQDFTLVTTGNILEEVLKASKLLKEKGIEVQILSCPLLKPFPGEILIKKISSEKVLVVDELNPYGGFASLVSLEILKLNLKLKYFNSISAIDGFAKNVGSMAFLRKQMGLAADAIATVIESVLKNSH